MKKDKKKKNRKYLFIFKYGLAAIVLVMAFTQLGMAYRNDARYEYVSVKVQSGDTVWQIASQVIDTQADIRPAVNEIMAVNHLKHSDDIYPGQVLQIPVKHTQAESVRAALHVTRE